MGILGRAVKGVATVGLSEVPGVKDYVNDAWDYGEGALNNVGMGAGLKTQPASFDVTAASKPIVDKANALYGSAVNMAGAAGEGPAVQTITPQQVQAIPGIGAGSIQSAPTIAATQIGGMPQVAPTQTVDAGSNVTGAGADALRQSRLEAAQAAASAPSSAAATLASSQGKIGRQMLGVAAGARGPERASARRAAMLGIGANGIAAGADAAALAVREQAEKAAALNQTLGSIQAGDVAAGQTGLAAQTANLNAGMTAQAQNLGAAIDVARANQQAGLSADTTNLNAWTDIVKANQTKDLAATTAAANLDLQRQGMNQTAGINAGVASNDALIRAYGAKTGAQNAYLGTALQAGGLENTNLGVQADYLGNYDALRQKQNAAAAGTVSQIATMVGLSDERAKTGIAPLSAKSPTLADSYTSMLSSAYGLGKDESPWGVPTTPKGQDFLAPPPVAMPATQETAQPQQAGGLGGLNLSSLKGILSSDERSKNVGRDSDSMAAWSDKVEPIAFRYKPGFEDSGEHGHVGVSAQQLEKTGPVGKALVYKDPNGMRRVNYPELAFAMSVAAKERADEAWDMSQKGAR